MTNNLKLWRGSTALVAATVSLAVACLATPMSSEAAGKKLQPFTGLSCTLVGHAGQASLGGIDRAAYAVRATGKLRAVMLFADTADGPHADDESTTQIYSDLVPPAAQGFRQASNGKLQLVVTPVHEWLRIPGAAASYDQSTFDGQRRFIQDAVNAAPATVNFRNYTHVYVVQALAKAHVNSPAFIALSARYGVAADGTRLRYGATFGADARVSSAVGSWILMHETGHTLGLPDLYNVRAVGVNDNRDVYNFAGAWDIMSDLYGHHGYSQWTRNLLGWVPKGQAACVTRRAGGSVVLRPQSTPGGTQLAIVPTSRSTAISIEQRSATGMDAGLCDGGVLISRVNSLTATGAGPMRVVPANASRDCDVLGHAPFARGAGERCSIVVDGIRVEVVAQAANTSTVRIRPARTTPDARVANCG